MEINDIVKDYAQQVNPDTETQQTESSLIENQVPVDQIVIEAESQAPIETSNDSAYEALLSGKSNISQNDSLNELVSSESSQIENLQTTTDSSDASGLEDVIEEDDFIKSKTDGKFESWEDVLSALNETKQPQFENEMSQSIYNMIVEGKIDELVEILGAKKFVEDIKTKDDEEVLKAYIKVNNPEFDDDDVDAEYNDNYAIDEYQFDESKLRREQKKLTQRIKTDVDNAKEFFDTLAQDVKFPELSQKQNEQQSVEDTELDSMIQEQRSAYLNSLQGVETRLQPLSFSWKDEKANMSVNGKFDIPAQELTKYKQAAEDLETYQVNRYYKDGQYQSDRLVKELYLVDNFDKIVTSAISQAVNQTRLEILKQSKNIQVDSQPMGTFKPNAAEEERSMYDQLFMGHLKRQQ